TYPDRERNFLKNLCIGDRRANLNRLSKWAKGWRVSAVAEISCRTASYERNHLAKADISQ
ncbi:MAG TPA: hypothetical protein VH374_01445, partial [Polyangia bacterium]|nr:hypothetical protein [Polyangia bacterium]